MSNVEFVVVDCLQVPKVLFQDERFKFMSVTAKILYSILLDRMDLAVYNNWIDEEQQPYVVYSKHDMQRDLNCTKYVINQALKELTSNGELVKVVCKNGIGNRFYLKNVGKETGERSMMTLTEIMENMEPDDKEKIMDKIVRVSKDIIVDMKNMGYIDGDDESEQEKDSMEERGYFMQDGSLDIDAIEADADDLGIELALNCSIIYPDGTEDLLDMQMFLNMKYEEETDLELMSAVETIVQVIGGSHEYIADMYACRGDARKIYLEQFIDSYNSITDTIVDNR